MENTLTWLLYGFCHTFCPNKKLCLIKSFLSLQSQCFLCPHPNSHKGNLLRQLQIEKFRQKASCLRQGKTFLF